jgi:DNA polymerase-3 subunit chi
MSGGSCEVWFYHLERTALERALPQLLEKTVAKGWRAIVRTGQPDHLDAIDQGLWTYSDDSFLAHGLAGEPLADRQPILLSGEGDGPAPNGAQALFLIEGAEAGDLSSYERCILLFDGGDETALNAARARWSRFKADGHPVSYWKQSVEGAWGKQA